MRPIYEFKPEFDSGVVIKIATGEEILLVCTNYDVETHIFITDIFGESPICTLSLETAYSQMECPVHGILREVFASEERPSVLDFPEFAGWERTDIIYPFLHVFRPPVEAGRAPSPLSAFITDPETPFG